MTVTVNGQSRCLTGPMTLAEFMDAELANTHGTAAAVDGEVIPRAEWAGFELAAGHVLELVTAVQGG